ncbi:MAG: AzlC family ABC transporter permease [Rhodocyclaceae bacterium]|nr:AzlC family ABC transporter permease [Rhodocyclaceae bacterium]MCO5098669.1 AzlC family ABC transporter permease [Rhodocyclaceae bacterium]
MTPADSSTAIGRKAAFLAGARACMPLSPGVLLFGMVCGAAAAGAGLAPGQSFALSWMVFAGSSQIVATQLFSADAPAWVIVLTGWVVNLRFMMYSATLAQQFRGASRFERWLAGYLLTDQAFAVTLARVLDGRKDIPWFYLGIAATLWLLWQLANLGGIYLGALVPASWSMDFVVALTFIGVLAPLLRDRAMAAAAVSGGLTSVFLVLPLKLNLMAAALIGAAIGIGMENLWPKSRSGA